MTPQIVQTCPVVALDTNISSIVGLNVKPPTYHRTNIVCQVLGLTCWAIINYLFDSPASNYIIGSRGLCTKEPILRPFIIG